MMEGPQDLNTLKIKAIRGLNEINMYYKNHQSWMSNPHKRKLEAFRSAYDDLVTELLNLDEVNFMSSIVDGYRRRYNASNLIQCDQGVDEVD